MPDLGQTIGVLVAMLIVVGLPAFAGYRAGRWRHATALAVVLGTAALLLTTNGYLQTARGRQLGTGDPDMAGLGDVISGFFSSAVGIILGFFACAAGLSRTARTHRWGRFALLLVGALLPLLAAVGVFDYLVLIVEHFHVGSPQAVERLAFAIAALAPFGIVAYGLWAAVSWYWDRRAGREQEVSSV
jgi:hypothetical protein